MLLLTAWRTIGVTKRFAWKFGLALLVLDH